MNLTNIPLLGMLSQRMSWLSARQDMLSQNVANADSPGYQARDLKPMDFAATLKHANADVTALAITDPHHIALPPEQAGEYAGTDAPDVASSPSGNTVSLEQQMIKVADTQAQYQAATNIYSKAMSMMRTAIGNP